MTLHKGENPFIYGLHDIGGEHLMVVGGQARGWVLVSEAIGLEAGEKSGIDYRDITGKGLGFIVELCHSFGSEGTIPREEFYPDFAQRCATFVAGSEGANIWLIGNQMNLEHKQPRQAGMDHAEPITPRRYATCYKLVREKIRSLPGHKDDLVIVGAVKPWITHTAYDADPEGSYPANKILGAPDEYPYNGYFGNFVRYWHDILVTIGPEQCDGMAIHAYSHGYNPDIVSDETKMSPPFSQYYYNFFTFKDLMNAVPETMRHLPVYLTQMSGDKEPDGSTWPFGNNGWIKNAYKEINEWNKLDRQQIRAAILYRWQGDTADWSIDGKLEVQQDFREAVAKNYKWNPQAGRPKEEPATPKTQAAPRPARPEYRTRYLKHTTPTSATAGQTIIVNLSIQNTGSATWVVSGDSPFRLGFQWYNAAGHYVTFAPDLDYRTELPHDTAPGVQIKVRARLRTPDSPGSYQLRWDMVHEHITWFSTQGDPGLVVPITVRAATGSPGFLPDDTVSTVPGAFDAEDLSASLIRHPTRQYPVRLHKDIQHLIIHHTATDPTVSVESIADYQVNHLHLPGIAYHFCITATGQVYQTQPLETIAAHAGPHSGDSVGLCLIGDFSSLSPPAIQQEATAVLLAQLASYLGLSPAHILGYSDIEATQSPGLTWPRWKQPLLDRVYQLLSSGQPILAPKPEPTPVDQQGAKAIEHYMLFWHHSAQFWAEWDLQGAFPYIARFKPVVGFDLEQAKQAEFVTIVGNTDGIPAEAEEILRAAGCKVERIFGEDEGGTRRVLADMVSRGRRFNSIK